MREKGRTVPRLTLLGSWCLKRFEMGLFWKLSSLTLTKRVSTVCLTKTRNHHKLVKCFYDFDFVWNSDSVLFSWTWLLSNSHLLDGHSPAQRLPAALGYFRGVRVWCMRGKKHKRVEWWGGEAWALSGKTPVPLSTATFLRKWEKIINLLHLCPVWTALLLVQPEGGMPP